MTTPIPENRHDTERLLPGDTVIRRVSAPDEQPGQFLAYVYGMRPDQLGYGATGFGRNGQQAYHDLSFQLFDKKRCWEDKKRDRERQAYRAKVKAAGGLLRYLFTKKKEEANGKET